MVRKYIGLDPIVSEGLISGGGFEEFIGKGDGDGNVGAGKCFEDGGVGVVELDAVNGVGFE